MEFKIGVPSVLQLCSPLSLRKVKDSCNWALPKAEEPTLLIAIQKPSLNRAGDGLLSMGLSTVFYVIEAISSHVAYS